MEQQSFSKKGGTLFTLVEFKNNSVIKIIMTLAVLYVLFHLLAIVFVVLSDTPASVMTTLMIPNTGISTWEHFLQKPWVLLTYFIADKSFWSLFTNMLWLYVFGNIFQLISNRKEIGPIFVFTSLSSGITYLILAHFLNISSNAYLLNSLPGVIGVAFATFALAPKFKYYLVGTHIVLPVFVVIIIFSILCFLRVKDDSSFALLFGLSAFYGVLYMLLLNKGISIGNSIDQLINKANKAAMPKVKDDNWGTGRITAIAKARNKGKEAQIDQIVAKLQKSGIESLSHQEKALLFDTPSE